MDKNVENVMENRKRISLDVQRWEPLKAGKFRVKFAQTNINISDITHEGKKYAIIKNLGRGRYIVKVEGPNNL